MPKQPKRYPKMWLYTAPKPLKSKVPDDLKAQVTEESRRTACAVATKPH
ncbi:MAG: hypothetical protein Q8Q33_07450 [Chlamydiota bacterium]|nr:hypothetical protein [Chlamydiota bacterium]